MVHRTEGRGNRPGAGEALAWVTALLFLYAASGCSYWASPEAENQKPAEQTRPRDPGGSVTAQKTKPQNPPELKREQPPPSPGKEPGKPKGYWVRVLRVIDGATMSLDNQHVVRLIGVLPPGPLTGKSYRDFFDRVTTPAVRQILEGKRVQLMRDKAFQGKDGRALLYVFLEDGTMINATLIQKGYARASFEVPFKFQDEFRLWQREAKNIGLGVWGRTGD